MTITTIPEESENTTETINPSKSNIQPGNYKLVGWDIDTTGKKPTDEICQIAGYTAVSQYSQYVMPFKDLSHAAKVRYSLKVITITRYRMLKDTKSNKIIKTKSEISALMEFINWLNSIKDDSDGIILVYHENRQVLPAILIESLKKYNDLYDNFNSIVKGFVNGCDIAKTNNVGKTNCFSMRTLARNFFNADIDGNKFSNAAIRAKIALQIVEYFINKPDENSVEDKNIGKVDVMKIFNYIQDYVQTIEQVEIICTNLKATCEREISLKPIFTLFSTQREKQQANPLCRMLAESEIEYAQLEQAWKNEKKEGLEKLINEKIKNAQPKGVERVLYILECYFNDEKVEKSKLELDKKQKISKKKKRFVKKVDTTNNDSGNDSGDNTLIQSPTKLDVSDTNGNKVDQLCNQLV